MDGFSTSGNGSLLGKTFVYRFYVIFGIGLELGFKWWMPEGTIVDPWATYSLITVSSIFFLSSFWVPFVKSKLVFLTGVFFSLMNCWLGWEVYLNDLQPEVTAFFLLLGFASPLIFESRRHLMVFSVVFSVAALLIALLVSDPRFHPITFLILAFSVSAVNNFLVGSRHHLNIGLIHKVNLAQAMQEAAISNSREAILLVDPIGRFIKANDAFCELWNVPQGLDFEELEERTEEATNALIVDQERYNSFVRLERGSQGEGDIEEFALVDGRYLEVYWRPLRYEGKLLGRFWTFRNASQEKAEEARLREGERRLRLQNARLMELAGSQALQGGDLDVAFKEITRACAELLEVDTASVWFLEESETTQMVMQRLYHRPEDRFETGTVVPVTLYSDYLRELRQSRMIVSSNTLEDPLTKEFAKGKYTGRAFSLMHAGIRCSGQLVGALCFENANGQREWTLEDQSFAASMADLLAVSIEAHERRQLQQELESNVGILQAIFDLSETGIIVEDEDHKVLKYNDLYLKTWNLTAEYLEKTPYEEQIKYLLGQIENSTVYEKGLEKLKVRPGMEYAGVIEFKDGKVVERYSKAIVVSNEVVGRVWFYLDVTERKRKETELIERNFELDSFVYRASHDLKAPLNSIMGLIDIIRGEQDLHNVLGFVGMMDKSVKKLDDFIRQLTQFSQDARLKVVCKAINLKHLLEDTLLDLKFMDNADRIRSSIEVDQEAEFYSDPVRLSIVLNNLMSNAIKYQDLKKEKGIMEIRAVVTPDQATIEIRDNGLGIDSEHLEKIFELFFRASVQATGSGLGLYITKSAVEKLGGEMKVSSKLGEGTTFRLIFPNLQPSDQEE